MGQAGGIGRHLIWFLILLYGVCGSVAQSSTGEDDNLVYSLTTKAEFYSDFKGTGVFRDFVEHASQFNGSNLDLHALDFSQGIRDYWFKLKLADLSGHPEGVIYFDNPHLDLIEIATRQDDEWEFKSFGRTQPGYAPDIHSPAVFLSRYSHDAELFFHVRFDNRINTYFLEHTHIRLSSEKHFFQRETFR